MEYISITNDVKVAQHFEACGVDDIMVDLETLGKEERQKGLNTVKSFHCLEDVTLIKESLTSAKCLVRVNPIHEDSFKEITEAIERGADMVMLPMFTTKEEVEEFVRLVGDKAQKYLLLETPQAMTRIDDILNVQGIDAVHIGLNDLSIGLGLDFLYEPVIGGLVEYMGEKIKAKGIKFGFGGVSRIELSQNLLSEHFRMGSEMVILNRHFRRYKDTYDEIFSICDLKDDITDITDYLHELKAFSEADLLKNKVKLFDEITEQVKRIKANN